MLTQPVLADFDRDGIPGLAVSFQSASGNPSVAVYKGDGKGGFSPFAGSPYTVPYVGVSDVAISLAAADFSHNGKLDLVVGSLLGSVVVLVGDGGGGFTLPSGSLFKTGLPPRLLVADLNKDGYADLVVGVSTASYIFLNNAGNLASQTNVPPTQLSLGFSAIAVGDLNGDSYPDLVGKNGSLAAVELNDTHGAFPTR